MARALLAQRFQETRCRQHQVHVPGHRFHDHARDLRALPVEQRSYLARIVVVEHQRMRRGLGGHACRTRIAKGQRARARLDQQRVGVAVVAAFELHDQAPASEAPRQADRRHGGFGARGHEPHEFERGHEAAEQFREFHLGFGRCAERQRARGGRLRRFDHRGMRVPGEHRPPGADIVDIALAVRVPQVRPRGALEERRRAADGAKCAYRRVHPGGNARLRARVEFIIS